MQEEIRMMVEELKAMKISVSTIEQDLGFSNGLLGKAAKGQTGLSSSKFEMLEAYYIKKANSLENFLSKSQLNANHPKRQQIKEPLIDTECQGVKEYCKKNGISVTELIKFHEYELTETKGKKSKKEEHLKEKIAPKPESSGTKLSLSEQIELKIKNQKNG